MGVTGHRAFDDDEQVARRVDEAIASILRDHPEPATEVWSALAEGADRLVAERLLERGAKLVALLPLDPDEYRRDFTDPASAAAFDRLLADAGEVRVARPAGPSRDAAYEAAGLEMLDAVDLLVAVWDGAPSRGRGGTAEIVAEAHRRGREVVVVPVTRDNVG